jgi:diguanylate cyclase (GGDEF)-like protein
MPTLRTSHFAEARSAISSADRDFVVGGITMAAILLMVGTGTRWVQMFLGWTEWVANSQSAIATTLLLNIALILFGWRRYRDLRDEVNQRAKAEAQALELASFDVLTGFYNRRALADRAPDLIADWLAEGAEIAALVVDIDAFKSINDLFGHAAGDAVIEATARRIATNSPADALLARLGGDEFAIIFPIHLRSVHAVDTIGERLAAELSQPVTVDDVSVSTSASVGGTIGGDAKLALHRLLRSADAAMYQAKRQGRCRYCRFDASLEAELAKRDIIERELRLAIAKGELYPVYEALVDIPTGRARGYEMLARWQSGILGQVAPVDFITVAEDTGLISSLSDLLYRRAFAEAAQWPQHLTLSINVSPMQLRDPWFAQKLLKLLSETALPPQRLVIELTESAIVDNLPLAQAVFTSLRNQGIRMALDDFGTGYSSIASLRTLPFDMVKIDREFVSRMSQTGNQDTIAEAVVKLGHSLGLPVVAEGIETAETLQRLANVDCAIGQGRYFGDAMTHDELMLRHLDETTVAPAPALGDAHSMDIAPPIARRA